MRPLPPAAAPALALVMLAAPLGFAVGVLPGLDAPPAQENLARSDGRDAWDAPATGRTGGSPAAPGQGAARTLPPLPTFPADVAPVGRTVQLQAYPAAAADGTILGDAEWRVVLGTGNCCENYLTATPGGRLADLGGGNVMFSDDLGLTWSEVSYEQPWGGGEGAIITAPDGSIVSGAWNGPDTFVSMVWDAATDEWTWAPSQTHPPVLDRPWLSIAPGPFLVRDIVAPYLSVLGGGGPPRVDNWLSYDRHHYVIPTDQQVDRVLNPPVEAWLDQPALPESDWIQPNTNAEIFALPGGGALARTHVETLNFPPSLAPSCVWRILGEDMHWRCFATPGGDLPDGRLAVDSLGRIHVLSWTGGELTYRISTDGARTWEAATAHLPGDLALEDWDFKANGALGLTAVAVHAHSAAAEADQDLLYRWDTSGTTGAPVLDRMFYVGDGDLNAHSSCCTEPRFDFTNVVILPDGTIATSYSDQDHRNPALAILLSAP